MKRQVRRMPALAKLVKGPSIRATVALRRARIAYWPGSRRLAPEAMNDWIRERIVDGIPSVIGKLGTLELELLLHDMRRRRDGRRVPIPRELRRQAFVNVGLFPPEDEPLWRALDAIREVLSAVDGIGVYGKSGERSLLQAECVNVKAISSTAGLEPWRSANPWSVALADKRVLVIHPFVETIVSQYEGARAGIWRARPGLLPRFELHTLCMPLSPALRRPDERDWSVRLDRMRRGMDKHRFDVALIGAGGMSLPLAAHAKAMGAVGLHMGGATQLLFGIRGRRWDRDPLLSSWFDEFWVRPSDMETPPECVHIEDRCYW